MQHDLASYVKIYRGILDYDLCKNTISELETANWKMHEFYSYTTDTQVNFEKELSVTKHQTSTYPLLMNRCWEAIDFYIRNLEFNWFDEFHGFSPIRFNRYQPGTRMEGHCDHIHSLFEGERKGVPILSVVGCLNEDFEGGDFVMWQSEKIPLRSGDIMVFPSSFLYPHLVTEVISGTRYSFVSWVW